MKKIVLIIALLIGSIVIVNAQSKALLVRGGYSWLSGVVGAEFQIGRFGMEAGWMPNKTPLTNEPVTSITGAITLYGNEWDMDSYYLSFGLASNGYQSETTSSSGYYDYESATMPILMLGYKAGLTFGNIKGGVGWGFYSGGGVFTFEINLGIRVFEDY